ncbi:hypothetical protein BG004_005623 [Podila humilis]|nr:hypothetical protein BG004_005623 [Podila humilis]
MHTRSPLVVSALSLACVASLFGSHALANAEQEAVAVENKTAYHPLLRQLTDKAFLSSAPSSKILYEQGLKLIESEGHVAPIAMSSLKWSLAMHTSAPWIEAHYHLYNSIIVPDHQSRSGFDSSCGVWANWYGRQICTAAELESVVASEGVSPRRSNQRPTTMDLDHVQAPADESRPFTILYADVQDSEFSAFRDYLDVLGDQYGLQYSVRYKPSVNDSKSPLVLAGYGVELALKSTDYIVIDDRDLGHGDDLSTSEQIVMKQITSKNLLGDDVPSVDPISESDLDDIGFTTTQFVMTAEDPLNTLVSVSQDFPKYQAKLAKMSFDPTLKSVVLSNQPFLIGGAGKVWLNNQPVPAHKMNPFSLLRMMRRDRQTIVSLSTMGLSPRKAVDLLTDISEPETGAGGPKDPEGVLDVRDKSEDKSLVIWLNDLQSDKRYKDWTPELINIVGPTYNGQFHQIRRNVISTLFVLDFSAPKALELVAFELSNYIQRLLPFRFGVLPLVSSTDGPEAKMAMLWKHVVTRYGIKGGLEFLKRTLLNQVQHGLDLATASQKSFAVSLQSPKLKSTNTPEMKYEEVVASDSKYRIWLAAVKDMTDRLGISEQSFFINGKYFLWEENHGQHLMLEAPAQTAYLGSKLLQKEISDQADLYEFFLTRPGVAESRNPYVFVSEDTPLKIVDLVQGKTRPFVDTLSFISSGDTAEQTTSAILTANFETSEGIVLALEALKCIGADMKSVRIALVQSGKAAEALPGLANFVRQSTVDGKVLPLGFWKELLEGVLHGQSFLEGFQAASSNHPEVALLGMEGSKGLEKESDEARTKFLEDIVQAKENEVFIIVNGRVIGPILDPFRASDFKLLFHYEQSNRINRVKSLLATSNIPVTAK